MVAIVAAAAAAVGKNHNPLTRVYESNGPDVKIRGTANHVAEKYIQLARDAAASGDPVAAENYYQHAEHYFRLIAAAQEQFRQNQPYQQQQPSRAAANSAPTIISTATMTAWCSRNRAAASRIPRASISSPARISSVIFSRAATTTSPATSSITTTSRATTGRIVRTAKIANEPADRNDHQPRQDQQPRFDDNRQPQQSGGSDGDVSGLPSFITGGGQPQQNAPSNGHDSQGDRFRGAAAGVIRDMQGGAQSDGRPGRGHAAAAGADSAAERIIAPRAIDFTTIQSGQSTGLDFF